MRERRKKKPSRQRDRLKVTMRGNALLIATVCVTVLMMAALYRPLDAATEYQPLPTRSHKVGAPTGPEGVAELTSAATLFVSGDHRNLFSYVSAPPPPAAPVRATPEVVPVAQVPAPEKPADPALTYRYLGTFGHASDPIAVFSRDGEVVNARIGESVDGFKIEHVAFDAVSVRTPQTNTQRTLPNRRE